MSKPSLIMVCGWGHPASDLEPLAGGLAEHFDISVLSVHEMAPAYSEKLAGILEQKQGPVYLLGWSMGGMVALETAARCPKQVAGLILVGATAKFCSDEDYPQGIPAQNLRAMTSALRKHPSPVLSQFMIEAHAPDTLDPQSLSAAVSRATALGIDNLVRDLGYLQSADLRKLARNLDVPALVLHGHEDRIVPYPSGQWLLDNLPRVRGVILKGISHNLPLVHTGLVTDEVLNFAQEHHAQTIRQRFSAAATTYDTHARVQNAVAAKLVRLIPPSDSTEHILEVGCGTGALTRHLLGSFPDATIDAIDISPKMIETASRSFSAAPTIFWHVADARSFHGPHQYELITSNCALHWLDPLLEGLHNLAQRLKSGGQFTFSIMLDGTLHELRESRLRVAPEKQPEGRLPRLSEVIDSLELSGCSVLESLEETEVELYPSASSFLRAIHDMGVTGGAVSRALTPLTRGELSRLITDYDFRYRSDNGNVVATYEVGYIKATKP
jgi:malonyl-CoA O-methyltransferase